MDIGHSANQGKANLSPTGSTTLTFLHTGYEKEQTTKATIGNGTITTGVQSYTKELDEAGNETGRLVAIGGISSTAKDQDGNLLNPNMLSGLNRDVNTSQVITKDQITGALDGSFTVDNRVFTSAGRSSIAKDFKDLGKNINQIGSGLRNNIIVKSIENSITDKETNLFQAINDYIRDDGKIADIQKDKELTEKMNGLTNQEAEGVRDTLQQVANVGGADGGFEGRVDLYEKYGSGNGYYYADNTNPENKTIGINVRTTDIAKDSEVINLVFHETTNLDRHNTSEQTAVNRGDTAEAMWGLKNFGNANTNQMSGAEWLAQDKIINSNTIQQGNSNYQSNVQSYVNSIYYGSGGVSFGQSNANPYDFKFSQEGKDFIKREEGEVVNKDKNHVAYYDSEKLPTIGVGHLILDGEMEELTKEGGIDKTKSDELFNKDLERFELMMNLMATREYSQNEVDAVGSLAFNAGPQVFFNRLTTEEKKYKTIDNFINTKPQTNFINAINSANTSKDEVKNRFEAFKGGGEKRREREANVYNYGRPEDYNARTKTRNSYNQTDDYGKLVIKLVNPIDTQIRSNVLNKK